MENPVKAIKELYEVMQIEGVDRKSGRLAREKALEGWLEYWIEEVEASQSIIKRGLTSEDEDFIKYYMSYKMGDRLMDNCIHVESLPNKISTKVLALRTK